MYKYSERPWIFAKNEYFSRFYITLGWQQTWERACIIHIKREERITSNGLLLLWEFSVAHSTDLQPEAAYSAQCEKNRMRKDRQEERSSWHFLLPICLSMSAASSGVALGRTPGSLKLARSSIPITKTNSTPPMAGMAGVRFDARNGQLEKREWKNCLWRSCCVASKSHQ